MMKPAITALAALAATFSSFGMAMGIAHAEPHEIKPGLTCDSFMAEFVNCTNTTNTDYTVIQTRFCEGGFVPSYSPNGYSGGTSYDPSAETVSIFVPANGTGSADNGCDYESDYGSDNVTYAVQAPQP